MWGLICCSTFGHVSLSDWPSWMLLKANLGSTRVIMESDKNLFLAVIWGRKGLHEGGGLAVLGRSVWERVWQSSGAGVVAVSADLVRRANPGEKKRGYRGEKAILGRWLLFRGEVVQAALRDIFREGVAFCGERLFGWTTGSVSVIVEAGQLQKGTWEKKDQRRRGWEFEGEFLA